MDNFIVIYKILKTLEQSLDSRSFEFDSELISPERLNITKSRRNKLLVELQKEGYIRDLDIAISPNITIKGLEYLSEDPMMIKARQLLEDVETA